MNWVVRAFSGQSVTTTATVTSESFYTGEGRLCGFFYDLADATTGTYVSATARILVAADSSLAYVTPVDSAGAVNNVLLININSNDRYVTYRYDDLPVAPWTQVQLVSATNQTITFAGVYLVYTDY